jgi:PadR family transcriptional regulator
MTRRPNLGEFEQMVLLAVLRLRGRGEDAYGMTVRRELAATAERPVTIGSVYGTLERLEAKRLVSSWHGDADPVRGGRARRYFCVEPAGEAALAESRAMMARMWEGVAVRARPRPL